MEINRSGSVSYGPARGRTETGCAVVNGFAPRGPRWHISRLYSEQTRRRNNRRRAIAVPADKRDARALFGTSSVSIQKACNAGLCSIHAQLIQVE